MALCTHPCCLAPKCFAVKSQVRQQYKVLGWSVMSSAHSIQAVRSFAQGLRGDASIAVGTAASCLGAKMQYELVSVAHVKSGHRSMQGYGWCCGTRFGEQKEV